MKHLPLPVRRFMQELEKALRDVYRTDAVDATFENEARINPEPAMPPLKVTYVNYHCRHCTYEGRFISLPNHVIQCPACQCTGQLTHFELAPNTEGHL